MEGLAARRLTALSEHLRACITSCNEVKAKLSAGDEITQAFRVEVEKLRNSSNRLVTEVHNLLQSGPNSETVTEEVTTALADANELQIAAEDLIVELDIYLKSNITSSHDSSSTISSSGHLPKLQLASFNGDILKWSEFWDRFTSVVDRRTDIPDGDKLAYLVGSLEGSAKQSIHGLELTNANYKVAVQKLNERFGKPNLIVDAHYAALGRLPVAKNTTIDCRRVLDTVERHLRTLENLGEDVNHNQLRTTILEKFPQDIVYELRMDMTQSSHSVKSLRDSLEKIVSARENSFAVSQTTARDVSDDSFTAEALVTTGYPETAQTSRGRSRFKERSRSQPQKSSSNFKASFRQNSRNSSAFQRHSPSRSHSSRDVRKGRSPGPPTKKRKLECVYCKGDHYNDTCSEFNTLEDRKRLLVQNKLCFQCLRSDHLSNACTDKRKCFHCGSFGQHNRSICPSQFNKSSRVSTTLIADAHLETILPTAVAYTFDTNGVQILIRIIFDTGSQKSYLTNSLARALKTENLEESELTVFTFGSMKPKHIKTSLITLKIYVTRDSFIEISAYAVPRITGNLSANFRLKQNVQEQYPDLHIARDTDVNKPADLLIGSDLYYSFVTVQIKRIHDNLYLVNSKLGWIVSGQQSDHFPSQPLTFLTYVSGSDDAKSHFSVPDPPLQDDNIKELWELEAIGIKESPKLLQQDEIINYFNSTTIFTDGRYHVKWPWMQYPIDLPLNLGMAIGRLSSLVKRLDAETLESYDEVLQNQLKLGMIEIVDHPEQLPGHPVHYLPHHCVIQEGKTTKLRVVYDASAKARSQHSLNDYLFKGPRMLEDLVKFLILFRQNSIAIVADIEKAFLQVGLQPDDRDVTRFVWLKDTHGNVQPDNIVHFRFKRVPFGIVSSPFLLAATIKYHLSQIDKDETKIISDSLYVDNLLCSVESLEQAQAIYSVATSTFNELSMNIRDWNSNSSELLMAIPKDKVCSKQSISVLGLKWDTDRDSLSIGFDVSTLDKAVSTKRDTLRVVASVFDPCGFIAPLTLPARLLHQDLWKDKCKWDDKITQERLNEWDKCAQVLKSAEHVNFPRAFNRPPTSDPTLYSYQIHCFTDASQDAYAAVVYMRISSQSSSNVTFLMSRSRLTPLKQRGHMTIPKLELLGVLIGVRLVNYVEQTLNITQVKTFLWTDSQIVIGWIRSDHLLPPFVARRVAEIRTAQRIQIRYVPTKVNPADVATRVILSDTLPSLWTEGPQFLLSTEEHWPVWSQESKSPDPVAQSVCAHLATVASTDTVQNLETTSAVTINESVTAQSSSAFIATESAIVPINNVNHEVEMTFPVSSATVVTIPHNTDVIRNIQKENFPSEVSGKTTDLTRSLRLFLDENNVLRCNAKLQNADLPFDQKYPILLPRDNQFTHDMIRKIHEDNYHVGVTHTLVLLRKQFWVPMGRSQVTKVIRTCKPCIKYGGGPYKLPEMPPLPKERVSTCPPFTYTGLDYFGPLTVLEGDTRQKRWCVLFTCMAVRAIHLELVQDMSTEEFLLAFRRFVAMRGPPLAIVSDNALQFKLSSSIIESSFCEKNHIQWRFIPELSPWQGGFYERLVGLVKHCLRRTLDKTLLSNNQLTTVIKEVECVLNTRPLTAVGTDLEHVLTPADFLSSVAPVVFEAPFDSSTGSITVTKTALVSSWKKTQSALNAFRSMFLDQYLTSLAERPLKPHKQPRILSNKTPSCGDIVQVKESSVGRGLWRVGQISELLPSQDGHTRSARVKMSNGNVLTRSISHLYPLEMADDHILSEEQSSNEIQTVNIDSSEKSLSESETVSDPAKVAEVESRPVRKAAKIARERILRLTENLLILSKKPMVATITQDAE